MNLTESKLRSIVREEVSKLTEGREIPPAKLAAKLEGSAVTAADPVNDNEVLLTLDDGAMLTVRAEGGELITYMSR